MLMIIGLFIYVKLKGFAIDSFADYCYIALSVMERTQNSSLNAH